MSSSSPSPSSSSSAASLRDYCNKQNYIKAVKLAQRPPQMNALLLHSHKRRGACGTTRAAATAVAAGANNASGSCHKTNSNYTTETPATEETPATRRTRRSNRTRSVRMKMPLSSSSGILLLLTLLLGAVVVVVRGTDVARSKSEFLQQITSTTTAAIGNELPLSTTRLIAAPVTPTTTALLNTTTTTVAAIADAETISASQWSSSSIATTTEPATATATMEVDAAILNSSATLLPVAEPHADPAKDEVEEDEEDGDAMSQPASDSLTKGFSIPTFLPPFPEFAMADLPAYTSLQVTTSTTTTVTRGHFHGGGGGGASLSPDMLQEQQDQLYLAAYNKHQLPKRNLTLPSTNVTVQLGSHAYMPCHIRRLLNKPVSWVRVRDGHILSVDQTTFIADQRFQSIFKGENEYTWSLQIKYVQENDAGWYECQVSTEPKMSAKVYLGVVVPRTELIGDQNRFVKAGSKVALHCIVRGTLEPPTYIIWFRGKTQIMDDNKIGWYTQIDRNIFGNTSDNQNTIGSLIIPFVRKVDSGNYTCQPSNSDGVSVDLHVLSGEYSASAIMSAARNYKPNAYYLLLILLLVALKKT